MSLDRPSSPPSFRLGIIGHPIDHSLSPVMHETALRRLGYGGSYRAIDVRPEQLPDIVGKLRRDGMDGFNVTLPHKERILDFLDEVDQRAVHIGAVNTVRNDRGRLLGTNTDVDGVRETLRPIAEILRAAQVLLLGAGGGARAVLAALVQDIHPAEIVIAARTTASAERLAADAVPSSTKTHVIGWEASVLRREIAGSTLLVNCTPVGMHPSIVECPLPPDISLPANLTVFDLIYRPLNTALLRRAQAAGCRTLSGLDMFLHQGARAFTLWTGAPMPMAAVRQHLLTLLSQE